MCVCVCVCARARACVRACAPTYDGWMGFGWVGGLMDGWMLWGIIRNYLGVGGGVIG